MAKTDEPNLESLKRAFRSLRADYVKAQLDREKLEARKRQLQKMEGLLSSDILLSRPTGSGKRNSDQR